MLLPPFILSFFQKEIEIRCKRKVEKRFLPFRNFFQKIRGKFLRGEKMIFFSFSFFPLPSPGIQARCWSRLLVWRFERGASETTTGKRRLSAWPLVYRFRFGYRARSAPWRPRRRATGRLGSPTAYWPLHFSSS